MAKTRTAKIIIILLLVFTTVGAIVAFVGYNMLYMSNTNIKQTEGYAFNIKLNASFEDVKELLYKNNIIKNKTYFELVAKLMKYPDNIKKGHYILKPGMSNKALIIKLRSGKQDPVKLILNNVRTKSELAARMASQLQTDSATFMHYLNDEAFLKKYDFNAESIISMFIPNTYQMYWDVKPEKFFDRMHDEYRKFWNANREVKLTDINLNKLQVMTLASIVEKESNKSDERPTIAGVYMNRLHQDWPLQADPTIIFALGDFSIKRVLKEYTNINSAYNTYKNTGLPPAPICMPSISSIDAVLNYQRHDYMFFCAKEDFSGYHNFATTLKEHNQNAKRYQDALDRQGVK